MSAKAIGWRLERSPAAKARLALNGAYLSKVVE